MTANPAKPVIVLLSASDTDLLAARYSGGPWRLANPSRTPADDVGDLLDGAFCVVVRLLGGRRSWEPGLSAVLAVGSATFTRARATLRPHARHGRTPCAS